MTHDQQVSPRLDLWVLYVNTALNSTTSGLRADGGHELDGRDDSLEIIDRELGGGEHAGIFGVVVRPQFEGTIELYDRVLR